MQEGPCPVGEGGEPALCVSVHSAGDGGDLVLAWGPGGPPLCRALALPAPPRAAQGVFQNLLEDVDDFPRQHVIFCQNFPEPRGKAAVSLPVRTAPPAPLPPHTPMSTAQPGSVIMIVGLLAFGEVCASL